MNTDMELPNAPTPDSNTEGAVRNSISKMAFGLLKYTAVLGIMVVAIFFVRRELVKLTWEEIMNGLNSISRTQLFLAFFFTAVNFVVLIGYDLIAIRYLKKKLPLKDVAVGAIVGYAFSNVVGWMLGGTAVRIRLYTRWGFSVMEVIAFISILTITFWLGMFMLAGIAFVLLPVHLPVEYQEALYFSPAVYGYVFLGCAFLYLLGTAVIRKPVKLGGYPYSLPPFRLSLLQLIVSATDFALASLVLYVLLPSDSLNYSTVLVSYLGAMIVVVAVHIPGGVGVLELFVIQLLTKDYADDSSLKAAVISALIFFRLIYHIIPAIFALGLYANLEFRWFQRMKEVRDAVPSER
jgi:glycosyltransferase 2 family protein